LIFRLLGNEAGTKLFYFLLCLLLKCNRGFWECYEPYYRPNKAGVIWIQLFCVVVLIRGEVSTEVIGLNELVGIISASFYL
jgi:hypothetical protein